MDRFQVGVKDQVAFRQEPGRFRQLGGAMIEDKSAAGDGKQ